MELTTVTLDGVTNYPALANLSNRWNGFVARPYFTLGNALAIFADINDANRYRLGVTLNADNSLTVTDTQGTEVLDGDATEQTFLPSVIDGVTMYAIGAGSWAWTEAN